MRNAIYVSPGGVENMALQDAQLFFGASVPSSAVLSHCTIGIIRSHAVKSKIAGHIIQNVLDQGLEISAL